jgi:hypothetical protein
MAAPAFTALQVSVIILDLLVAAIFITDPDADLPWFNNLCKYNGTQLAVCVLCLLLDSCQDVPHPCRKN